MKITAKEFDKRFEKEDISKYLDFKKAVKLKDFDKKIVKLELSKSIYDLIDKEAKIVGIKPDDLIKVWIVERLKEIKSL